MNPPYFKYSLLVLSFLAVTFGKNTALAKPGDEGHKKYVLSIDGGGVRGIVAARILQEIETRTGKHIHELFDLIIGNSTGGILALGLAMPDAVRQGKAKYTAQEFVKFYQEKSATIFPQNIFYQLLVGWGLWGPKYSRGPLDKLLKAYMGDAMLGETLVPVAVTSYSLDHAAPHLWTTRRASAGPENDYFIRDVAGATSAAPIYFAPKIIQRYDGTLIREADGGIWANNPEIIAITELQAMQNAPIEPKDVFLVSIASHIEKAPYHRLPDLQRSGLIGWVLSADLISLMIDADVAWAETAISTIYPNSNRIKIVVPAAFSGLDDSSARSINALMKATEDYIAQHEQELDSLCCALVR